MGGTHWDLPKNYFQVAHTRTSPFSASYRRPLDGSATLCHGLYTSVKQPPRKHQSNFKIQYQKKPYNVTFSSILLIIFPLPQTRGFLANRNKFQMIDKLIPYGSSWSQTILLPTNNPRIRSTTREYKLRNPPLRSSIIGRNSASLKNSIVQLWHYSKQILFSI